MNIQRRTQLHNPHSNNKNSVLVQQLNPLMPTVAIWVQL